MAKRRARESAPAPAAEITPRDFVLARLAAGNSYAQGALEAIQEFVALCLDGDDEGEERVAALQAALEQLGCATRALEAAEAQLPNMDMAEIEPWED